MNFNTFIYKIKRKVYSYLCPYLSDELYLKLVFKNNLGYSLNLRDPKSFNEKLQWLKLNDIHPEYTDLVDKVEVKKYVSSKIGESFLIPTIAVYNSVEEINWDSLPNQFVVKCTGDSGGVVVCSDKKQLDIKLAKKKLLKGFGKNYSKFNKEYPYKNVQPRLIAENYLVDESGYELKDYKFFCFNGVPKFLFVASGRQKGDIRFDFFDTEFNHLSVTNDHPNADEIPVKPANFREMITVAADLSKGFPHVRVDLYNCNGKIYFGEMTFFHFSGMHKFEPIEWDYKFGEFIDLSSLM